MTALTEPMAPATRGTTTFPASAGASGDHTACALATRAAEQILDVLAARAPVHVIRDCVSAPVAGLLAGMLRRKPAAGPELRLRSVHACLTTASKVEACAVIAQPSRVRSLTIRLEKRNNQWKCTLLKFL